MNRFSYTFPVFLISFFLLVCTQLPLPGQAPLDLLSETDTLVPVDTLVVGYNIAPPFVTKSGIGLEGPSVWLWDQVAKDHNIVFEYRQLRLDSLLYALSIGEVDLSLSPLTITSERSEVIDFSSPYYIAHSALLQKESSGASQTLEFLGSFFSLNFLRVLGGLFLTILVFGWLVWLFERRGNPEEFGTSLKGLWSGFWWSAVTMSTVGYGDKSPRTTGGRIIALVWMFTAIIIISGFTATITSSLTVSSIGSESDLIDDFKKNKMGTIQDSGTHSWMQSNFFTKRKAYPDMNELLAALDREEIEVVAYDRPILQSMINADTLERYQLLPIDFNPQFYATGMSRNLSPQLRREINHGILRYTEDVSWKVHLSEYGL